MAQVNPRKAIEPEFEISLSWRYKPDPRDYDIDPWEGMDLQDALAKDIDNARQGPAQYVPSSGVVVSGSIVSAEPVADPPTHSDFGVYEPSLIGPAAEALEAYATTPLGDEYTHVSDSDTPESFAPVAIELLRDLLMRCHFAELQGKPQLSTIYIRRCIEQALQPEGE